MVGSLTRRRHHLIEQRIVQEIENFRLSKTGSRAGWYAGITQYPYTRRDEHNAGGTDWIHRQAGSERNARDTEGELHRLVVRHTKIFG